MATGGMSAAVMRDLECPVCHEVLTTPKMLPCGHSLCASPCLQRLAGYQDHVKCPECRAVHTLPLGGTSSFPTNFFLCRVVENSKTTVCLDQSCCPGCSADSVILRRCSHCACHICGICRQEHTDIMKKDLMKQFAECSGQIKSAEFDQDGGPAMKRLEVKVTAMHDQLEQVTEAFHQVINQRKLELYQSIDDFKTGELGRMLAHKQRTRDAYVTFCKEKQQILAGDVPQPTLVQLEEELCDKMDKFQLEANDFMIFDATLHVDKKMIAHAQALSKFGEIKDSRPMLVQTKKTKRAVLLDPVVQAVPLDIKRQFTKVKHCIGGQGTEPGLFDSPTAVRVSPVTDNIVVADNSRIQIFTPRGEFIHSFSEPYDNFNSVKHLEISIKGDIVILNQNQILAFYGENGRCIHKSSVKFCLDGISISMAVAPNGDVHVGRINGGVTVMRQGKRVTSYSIERYQYRADRIFFTKSGTIYIISFTDRSDCQSEMPRCDHMFVFNRENQLINQMDIGEIERNIMCTCTPPYCQLSKQSNITVPRGSLRLINDKYFMTTDPESSSITIYDLQWNMIKEIGTTWLYRPLDAAVTLDGQLVVVSDNHMMHFF